jgi:hypothetical protein
MAEESNPQPFGVITVFKTACRPRSETIRRASYLPTLKKQRRHPRGWRRFAL